MLPNKIFRPLVLLTMCLNITACASLVIEVDVYKGPLINSEKVQIEETAILALASKPLLEMVKLGLENPISPDNETPGPTPASPAKNSQDPIPEYLGSQIEMLLCLYERCSAQKTQINYLEPPLNEGLKKYLEKSDDDAQKELFLGQLTRFAARLRVLGNFSILAVGQEEGIIEEYYGELSDKTKSLRYFIQVLQAVGNSILFQVDSIRLVDQWIEKQKNGAIREQLAIASSPFKDILTSMEIEDTPKSSIEALDLVISTLEYKYIASLKDSSINEEVRKALKASLTEGYRYRASLTFLRSSTEFLRTSYPATTLQESKPEEYKNATLRLLTNFFLPLGPRNPTREFLKNELDKQYWQNINQIRLVAGGNTNYAVVKDDVGNWYIKGFSTNPNEILESIKLLPIGAMIKASGLP